MALKQDKILKDSLKTAKIIECPTCGTLISIQGDVFREIQWWEMLDWNTMPETFAKLPKNIQEQIRKARLINECP